MTNPFCSSSLFTLPLLPEVCQQIHAEALLRVARSLEMQTIPSSVPVARLRELIRHRGPEICLLHPTEITHLFCGVTFSVYQHIEALYCSKIERSIQTITAILSVMAKRATIPPIHEEAIWALCLHLDERRERMIRVTTQPSQAQWWLGAIAPGVPGCGTEKREHTTLVGVIDISTPCVLAFRAGTEQSLTELATLSLYDALVAARRPHARGAGGLIWNIPSCLLTTETLLPTCTPACVLLGMSINACARSAVPLIEEVETYWRDIHTQASVPLAQRAVVFESILNRAYGSSPLRAREQAHHHFGHLLGHQSDPASFFPALRTLLPPHDASISVCGEIFSDGLHYTDDLLALFPGASVSIRRSEQTEAIIWVYLDGEILGEARARELVRRDGSYRAHR